MDKRPTPVNTSRLRTTMPNNLLVSLSHYLNSQGFQDDAVKSSLALDLDVAKLGERIPYFTFCEYFDKIDEMDLPSCFWYEFGTTLSLANIFCHLERWMFSCPDIHYILKHIMKYLHLDLPHLNFSFVINNDTDFSVILTPDHNHENDTFFQKIPDLFIGTIERIYQLFPIRMEHLIAIKFSHAQPKFLEDHQNRLNQLGLHDKLHFKQHKTEHIYSLGLLKLPILSCNPVLNSAYEQDLETQIALTEEAEGSVCQSIKNIISQSNDFPSMAKIANTLNVTERTLHRRLQEEGTSYRDLLKCIKAELAATYLLKENFSIEDIAIRLGYSDRRNFTRAFQEWHQQTPSEYRRSLRNNA